MATACVVRVCAFKSQDGLWADVVHCSIRDTCIPVLQGLLSAHLESVGELAAQQDGLTAAVQSLAATAPAVAANARSALASGVGAVRAAATAHAAEVGTELPGELAVALGEAHDALAARVATLLSDNLVASQQLVRDRLAAAATSASERLGAAAADVEGRAGGVAAAGEAVVARCASVEEHVACSALATQALHDGGAQLAAAAAQRGHLCAAKDGVQAAGSQAAAALGQMQEVGSAEAARWREAAGSIMAGACHCSAAVLAMHTLRSEPSDTPACRAALSSGAAEMRDEGGALEEHLGELDARAAEPAARLCRETLDDGGDAAAESLRQVVRHPPFAVFMIVCALVLILTIWFHPKQARAGVGLQTRRLLPRAAVRWQRVCCETTMNPCRLRVRASLCCPRPRRRVRRRRLTSCRHLRGKCKLHAMRTRSTPSAP